MENKPTPQPGDGANVSACVGTNHIQPREDAPITAETAQQVLEPITAVPMPTQPGTGAAEPFSDPSQEAVRLLNSVATGTDIPEADPWAARSAVDAPTLEGLKPFATDLINELSKERQVPVEFYLAPIIAAVGAAAGNKIKVKALGYSNTLNLAVAVIAPSGSNKSTPGRDIMKPLHDINEKFQTEYRAAKARYEEERAKYLKSKDKNNPAAAPIPPKKRYLIIDNASDEARKARLMDNPHGILQYNDELAAMFSNLGKYTKSSNEIAELIQILDGQQPVSDTRLTREDTYIREPHLCVYGTTQPPIALKYLATEDGYNSGLTQRFLLFQPTRIDFENEGRGDVEKWLCIWSEWVNKIYGSGQWAFAPDEEAIRIYEEFRKEAARIQKSARSDAHRSVVAKLKITVWKLAGVAHLLNEVSEGQQFTQHIKANEMRWAVSVCKYLYRKQMEMLEQSEMGGEVKPADVVGMILRFRPDANQSEIAQLLGINHSNVRKIKSRIEQKKTRPR